jgi:Na+-transporting NADH:ubiquinone oxidoreductase subunit F
MKIHVHDEVFGVKKWETTVRSNNNVATFIKELVLELPTGETVNFRAGGYIQIECPRLSCQNPDFDVEERIPSRDWDKYELWRLESDGHGTGHSCLLDGQLP